MNEYEWFKRKASMASPEKKTDPANRGPTIPAAVVKFRGIFHVITKKLWHFAGRRASHDTPSAWQEIGSCPQRRDRLPLK